MCVLGLTCKWCFFSYLIVRCLSKMTNTTLKTEKNVANGHVKKNCVKFAERYTPPQTEPSIKKPNIII